MRRLRLVALFLLAALGISAPAFAQTEIPGGKAGEPSTTNADSSSAQKSAGPEPDGRATQPGDTEKTDDSRLAITRDVMDEFAAGALTEVRDRFDADLKNAVSESDIQDAHDQLFEVAGAFQSQLSQAARLSMGIPVYVSRSKCARYLVELRLTFDDANRITDFRIGPVSSLSAESMEAAAREVADLLEKGQFADVNAKFNARLKGNMPADRLEASWSHIQRHLGAFKSIQSARKDPDLDRVDVRCEFEQGPIIIRVAFDPAGKVSGLWMLPAETEKDSQV